MIDFKSVYRHYRITTQKREGLQSLKSHSTFSPFEEGKFRLRGHSQTTDTGAESIRASGAGTRNLHSAPELSLAANAPHRGWLRGGFTLFLFSYKVPRWVARNIPFGYVD